MSIIKNIFLTAVSICALSSASAYAGGINVDVNLGGPAYAPAPVYAAPSPAYVAAPWGEGYDPHHRRHDWRYWHDHHDDHHDDHWHR